MASTARPCLAPPAGASSVVPPPPRQRHAAGYLTASASWDAPELLLAAGRVPWPPAPPVQDTCADSPCLAPCSAHSPSLLISTGPKLIAWTRAAEGPARAETLIRAHCSYADRPLQICACHRRFPPSPWAGPATSTQPECKRHIHAPKQPTLPYDSSLRCFASWRFDPPACKLAATNATLPSD